MPYMKPKKATKREEADARAARARRRRTLAKHRAERKVAMEERGRKKNASPEDDAASMAAMRDHLEKIDSEILFAEGAYGRKPTVQDWKNGKDFVALRSDKFVDNMYFNIEDVEMIYDLGYRKIVFGGAEGFDIDLVMQ